MRLQRFVAIVCGTSLSAFAVANAQQQQPVQQPARPGVQVQVPGVGVQVGGQQVVGQPVQQAGGMVNDHALASCIAIENQEEIALAKFAKSKADNKDVKEFAEMLEKDHTEFLQKLQRFAPEASREGYLTEAKPRVQRNGAEPRRATGKVQPEGEAVQNNAAQPQVAVQGQNINFMQLHREIAEECLAQAKQELGKKDEKEFDHCFIGMQIVKHAAMRDKLTVFERHSGPELNKLIADGLQTTEEHLKKAEKLMKNLKDLDDRRQAAKD